MFLVKKIEKFYEDKICIIDADLIPYTIAWIAFKNDYSLDRAKQELDAYLLNILQNNQCPYYMAFLTGGNQFRYGLKADYKASRKGNKAVVEMEFLLPLKQYLIDKYHAFLCNGIESDDACGIFGNMYPNAVICHNDKDLDQLPGFHYSIKHKSFYKVDMYGYLKVIETVKENEVTGKTSKTKKLDGCGKMLFWAMMLIGDKDECDGLKGYGAVKAYNVLGHLNTEYDCINAVLKEYISVYNDIDEAKKRFETNYQLLYLLRRNQALHVKNLKPFNIYDVLDTN